MSHENRASVLELSHSIGFEGVFVGRPPFGCDLFEQNKYTEDSLASVGIFTAARRRVIDRTGIFF